MKKFLIYSLSVGMMALSLLSCNDGNDEHTDKRVTYYATLELNGAEYMVVDKGSTYEEPGFSAEMQGEDASDKVVVNSNVDTSTSGVYSVAYSIVNADGFSVEKVRTVVVLDPNDPVEGPAAMLIATTKVPSPTMVVPSKCSSSTMATALITSKT